MRDDWMYLYEDAGRHLTRVQRARERGDAGVADAHAAVGAAYQLFSDENDFTRQRGAYLKPMAEFGTQTVPDLAFLAQPRTLDLLRSRLPRTRQLARRARIGDVLWEFGGDAAAAREARAAYEAIASGLIGATKEFAAYQGAGAIARAYVLARVLNDRADTERLAEAVVQRIEQLSTGDEHAALYLLVELLAEVGGADDAKLARVQGALETHLTLFTDANDTRFTAEQRALEALGRIVRGRHDSTLLPRVQRDLGESIAREAEWKLTNTPNGGLVAGFFFEKAAKHFESIGDPKRAAELRDRERGALSGAEFHTIESTVEVDLTPYRRWLEKVFASNGLEAFWLAWLFAVRLPNEGDIQSPTGANRTSIVDLFGVSVIDDDLIVESTDPEESRRRRARHFAYLGVRAHVLNLFGVARDVFKVTAASVEAVLAESGRFDDTGQQLLHRVLAAVDARDWMSAAYLAMPIFERLIRQIAQIQQIPVRGPEKTGRRITYRPLEDILRRLTLEPELKSFGLYVLGYPGVNLRNEVAHGLLEADQCTDTLGATVLYLLCALSFEAQTPADSAP